jgi:two-component system chemotaxis response regulator CheY
MLHHRAYGLGVAALDVVVVDDAKPMQSILRSILLNAHVGRVRTFDGAETALQAMLVEPPHLLITDWHMPPTDGLTLVRSMRRRRMGQLALVPAIMITAHPTRALVEEALQAGVHFVIAKPVSPATLIKRIAFVQRDARGFSLLEDERTVVLQGQAERVSQERLRRAAQAARALKLEGVAEAFRAATGTVLPAEPVEAPAVDPAGIKPTMRDLEASNAGLTDQATRLGGFAPVGGRKTVARPPAPAKGLGDTPGQPAAPGA